MSTPHTLDDAAQRRKTAASLLFTGGISIVAGGLVAAVTGPTNWDRGAWVANFLVLVAGVAQIGIDASQAHLSPTSTGSPWTAGNRMLLSLWM